MDADDEKIAQLEVTEWITRATRTTRSTGGFANDACG
jgi:hypothetical protein